MSIDLLFLIFTFCLLLAGYPVALTLGGASIVMAVIVWAGGQFDGALFHAIPSRIFGVLTNPILVSIPLFVVMGYLLEKSNLAADMLGAAARLFQRSRAGLCISVTIVGTLLAASTGIVGASVVTLGLFALPSLLARGVAPHVAAGTVAASGTLGQIIPPSIVLIVLGDQISNAWQKSQLDSGNFAPDTVTVTDLFLGAILPGLLLVGLYCAYFLLFHRGTTDADLAEIEDEAVAQDVTRSTGLVLVLPLLLIIAVLGSILAGIAAPSEAAAIGAFGALLIAGRRLSWGKLNEVVQESAHLTAMIMLIVVGASLFSLTFRGLGGEETIASFLNSLPGGTLSALVLVMGLIFLLGFFLEFLEITYVVVPLVAPVLLAMPMADGSAMSPVWLGILIALNLQTSFLTPPFGVSLFYLRSVAPESLTTPQIYRGVAPFVVLQLLALGIVVAFPQLATFLPRAVFGQ